MQYDHLSVTLYICIPLCEFGCCAYIWGYIFLDYGLCLNHHEVNSLNSCAVSFF